VRLDAFWDGETSWTVRFAPPHEGEWTWRTVSPGDDGLDGREGRFDCVEPSRGELGRNPNLRGHLQASRDGRHLEYSDGTPFFWLGDTFWAAFTKRCSIEPGSSRAFCAWVDDRVSKRFSVEQVFLMPVYSEGSRNEGGWIFDPLDDYAALNPPYFQAADVRMRYMWERGLVVALCGAAYKLTPAQATDTARYTLARFGAYNLVYALSPEYHHLFNPLHVYEACGEARYTAVRPEPWEGLAEVSRLGCDLQRFNPHRLFT